MLGLEIISLTPAVICPLCEFLFKACDAIHCIEEIENFGLEGGSACFALTDPQEPFLVVVALEKLHADESVARMGCEFHLLPAQFAGVVLVNSDVGNLTLAIDLELRHCIAHRESFPQLCLRLELVKFDLRLVLLGLILLIVAFIFVIFESDSCSSSFRGFVTILDFVIFAFSLLLLYLRLQSEFLLRLL